MSRSVNDPEILFPAALHGWRNQPTVVSCDELKRLKHDSFAAGSCRVLPSIYGSRSLYRFLQLHHLIRRREQDLGIRTRQSTENVHVPLVIFIGVYRPPL